MTNQFDEFLDAVETLRDSEPVRMTAHTSNAATETWLPQPASPISEPEPRP